MKRIPAPAIGVKLFVFGMVMLWLVAFAAGQAEQLLMDTAAPAWGVTVAGVVGSLAEFGMLLLTLIGLWRLIATLVASLSPALTNRPVEVKQPDPAAETMDRVAQLLAKIEPNTVEGEARLRDAQMATEILTRQVLKVVERVERLEREAGFIAEVVDAIRAGQREEIVYLAGKVGDDSLRTLLLSPYLVTRSDFRTETFVLLANERGALEESAAGYGRLVTALCGQLAQARTRIIGLQQQIQMLEASHPILLIEQGLSKSIDALNLRAQPALRWTAKQALPAGVQGYLKG